MKMSERIRKRLSKDRPMTTISIRIPDDMIDDLKSVAPALGFSGYQPLIRAYVGQGLRKDLVRLESDPLKLVLDGLRRHGVDESLIAEVVAETRARGAHSV
jgi:hypothetical protein